MDNLLVSVILPAYNAEETCSRAIESVLAQSYDYIELIIIDDGSIDDTYQICCSYADRDQRVRVIQQKNGGVSKARNVGLKKARGSYVAFIDADDYMEREFILNTIAAMKECDADIVCCGFTSVTQKDTRVWLPEDTENIETYLITTNGLNMLWNKLFKMELIDMYFNEESSMGEDLEFVVNYYKAVKSCAVVKKPLYTYYSDTQNSLTKKTYLILDSIGREVRLKERFLSYRNKDPYYAWAGVPGYLLFLLKKSRNYKEFKEIFSEIIQRSELMKILENPYRCKKDNLIARCLRNKYRLILFAIVCITK